MTANAQKPTLVVRNARSREGTPIDIVIAGGTIAQVSPCGGEIPADVPMLDAGGALASPSFVEGHIHLDKTLLGLPLIPHQPGGTVAARVQAEKALRRSIANSVQQCGGRLIEQVAAFGSGTLRSHVDIDSERGLSGLHDLLALKERYHDLVDMQIVVFPQSGILRDPGTRALMDEALGNGADLVGGLDPASMDGDVTGHLDAVFALAERHGKGIDIHLHDYGSPGASQLREIAARTRAAGLEGRVTVSHAFALGSIAEAELGETADALAAAAVSIMTNGPARDPMPPVPELLRAGVNIFAGSDNIRDSWWPWGDGDMLDRARLIGYLQGMNTIEALTDCFAMATDRPAKALGLEAYGLEAGRAADIVLLEVASVPEAVLERPLGRTVIKRGRVIAKDGALVAR